MSSDHTDVHMSHPLWALTCCRSCCSISSLDCVCGGDGWDEVRASGSRVLAGVGGWATLNDSMGDNGPQYNGYTVPSASLQISLSELRLWSLQFLQRVAEAVDGIIHVST